jgi:FtsZ-binding cell division protein ZapB
MKEKCLIILLVGVFMYTSSVRPMGWLDFCATWLTASYAYHAWCQWNQNYQIRPAKDVIKELKICLGELKEKIYKEQQDIKQCQYDLEEIKEEMNRYKDRWGIAS